MGTVDLFHSRRTAYAVCEYWIRDERNRISPSEWILNHSSSGTFFAREVSPKNNQMNQAGNVFAFDRDTVTLQCDDDIKDITRGSIVKYNGEIWMVDNVQASIHRKESQFNVEIDYNYIVSLRK